MQSLTLKLLLLSVFLNCAVSNAQKLSQQGIPLIIVKEQNNRVIFDKIFVKRNQIEVIADSSVITIILPISAGKAANFVKPLDRQGIIIVKNNDDLLNVTFRSSDGEEKTLPSLPYDKLKTFQIRVNIISGKGYKKAFVIDNYDLITEDDGPVLDIFGGMIPMEDNDYSITTETNINILARTITGSVPFIKIDEWIVVEAKLPGGRLGKFIIDTGASGGIVLKQNALPVNTEISELKAVSYSEKGQTESQGKMQTVNGTVEDSNFLGVGELLSFEMGNIKLRDLKISVLKELPEFLEKHDIIGIIGIKILKRAEIMRIENINQDKGVVKFMNLDKNISASHDYSFSLNTASNLLFIKGAIQSTPIDFLVDIGARRSVISSSLVDNNHMVYSTLSDTKIMGLNGEIDGAIRGNFQEVMIENELFNEFPFIISSNLFATKAMGLEKSGSLLGMSFYSKFGTMEIDFVNNRLYLN